MVNADDLNQVTTDLQGKPTDDTAQDPNAIVGNTSTQSTADEQSFAGSAPGPGSDDDVGAMMAQVTGNEPPTG